MSLFIYSDGLPEHITHVQEVLQRLHANSLFACADKCGFHVTSCEYLRYICYLPRASLWHPTKSKLSKTGRSLGRLKTFNPSSGSPTFTVASFTNTPRSQFHLHGSPTRVLLGTLPMSAIQPSRP